jgi:hypothetical protein
VDTKNIRSAEKSVLTENYIRLAAKTGLIFNLDHTKWGGAYEMMKKQYSYKRY